jgi:DNA repair protein RecO (recombination protein O)
MTQERTKAIVLRRTDYGEADRVLSLLTPGGKRAAIARGVRREKSKLAGGIELFSITDVTIHRGARSSSELGILTSARIETFFGHIIEDYDRLQFGYECTRLVAKASEGHDSEEWYEVLAETYRGLGSATISLQLTQSWWYLRYAELTGYSLSLARDVTGAAVQPDARYSYDTSERGLRPNPKGAVAADHIKYLRLLAAKPLMSVAQIGGVDAILPECWQLTRQHAAV